MNKEDLTFYRISEKPMVITDINQLVENELIDVKSLYIFGIKAYDTRMCVYSTLSLNAIILYNYIESSKDRQQHVSKGRLKSFLLHKFNKDNILKIITSLPPDSITIEYDYKL